MNRTEAQTALARLQEEKARAASELAAAREGLDRLETESGDRLLTARLDGDETAAKGIREELAAARGHVSELEKIAVACDRAIRQGEKDVLAAEAAELREDVLRRWPEVRNRIDETAKVLDALFVAEGCRFWPGPQPLPSGACPEGSMMRTATGRLMADIADLERRATVLETQAGLTPQNSIMAAVLPSAAWHFGSVGVLVTRPLVVHGSQLDDASAALAGREVPKTPDPTAAEIAAARGNPSTWRG